MSDKGWLMREFERARERSATVPPHAKPTIVGKRKPDPATDGWAHEVDKAAAFTVRCPMCRRHVLFDVFVESWTRLDEEAVSRARISVPLVHACTGE